MKPANIFKDKLYSIIYERIENGEPSPFNFRKDYRNCALDLEILDGDKYSLQISSFLVRAKGKITNPTIEDLKGLADRLSAKMTYFLENIQVIEVDAIKLEAQLRSDIPGNSEKNLSFFEINIQDNTAITLKRFEFDKVNKTKKQVPFLLTKESFEKAVNDFTSILSPD